MTDDPTPTPDAMVDAAGDPALERRLRGALAVLADDVAPPRPPDLPRFAAFRRRRRLGVAAATLAAGMAVAVAAPVGWSVLRPTRDRVAGPVKVAGVLTVSCTPTGVEVDADHVEVSADGVHLRVLNRSGRGGTWFSYSGTAPGGAGDAGAGQYLAGQDGSVAVPDARTELVVLNAPPVLSVGCSPGSGSQPTQEVEVRLDDPHRQFRAVDVTGTLGCSPDMHPLSTGVEADSMQKALDRLAGGFPAPVQILPGPGYRAARDLRTYLAKGPRTRAVILVGPVAGGRYQAIASSFCAPGSWRG